MSTADLLARYRDEAIQTAKDFGVEVTDEQIEAHAHRLLANRTAREAAAAARPTRVITPVPQWLSYEPFFDAYGNRFGRRYFTADGYEARPGLGRLAKGDRPNRWHISGPDGYESVATTIAEILAAIEHGRSRPRQQA